MWYILIIIRVIRNGTLLDTLESYNLKDNSKQLVIFTILNYIFENIYTILKTKLYDHDKKLFTICE